MRWAALTSSCRRPIGQAGPDPGFSGHRPREPAGGFPAHRRWPSFHIQHLATKADAPLFSPDTPYVEFHESIRPLPGERVIAKHFPNSFHQTPLLQELKARNVDQAVIVGAMSHMCIDATTRAAYDLGMKCTLIHDACATRDLDFGSQHVPAAQVHASFMAALGWWYADLVCAADFVAKRGKSIKP